MIKTVIFDLDGTLLNTLEDLKNSTNFAMRKFGYPERTLEEVRGFVGNGVRKLIERAIFNYSEEYYKQENSLPSCPHAFCSSDIDRCLECFKKHYSENMYNKTAPYDGILEVLNELHNNGIKIGVVSNKFDAAVKELCKKYFKDLVDIAIGQSEDVLAKPSPTGVLKVMEILGADKNSTVYVGDSDVDVMTAKNANLSCIGVLWGFRDKENLKGADFIIDKPYDIINTIRSL